MGKLARLPNESAALHHERDEERRIPRLRTRYYAFLSYSHKDKDLADWLHRELERVRVPSSIAGKLTSNGVVPKRLTPSPTRKRAAARARLPRPTSIFRNCPQSRSFRFQT